MFLYGCPSVQFPIHSRYSQTNYNTGRTPAKESALETLQRRNNEIYDSAIQQNRANTQNTLNQMNEYQRDQEKNNWGIGNTHNSFDYGSWDY